MLKEILKRLEDGSTICNACIADFDRTNSTAAVVSLLKVRELLESEIASQPVTTPDAKSLCKMVDKAHKDAAKSKLHFP